MTKARKTAAYLETHADLARTVNMERRKQGLPLNSVPMKTKSKLKLVKKTRAERPAFRASFMPPDYIPIEQSRLELNRQLGYAPAPEAPRPVEEKDLPYYVRD